MNKELNKGVSVVPADLQGQRASRRRPDMAPRKKTEEVGEKRQREDQEPTCKLLPSSRNFRAENSVAPRQHP